MKSSHLFAVALLLSLSACKIVVNVPPGAGGYVRFNENGYGDACSENCEYDVVDIYFDRTFVAVPKRGYSFSGWKQGDRQLCGGSKEDCHISTAGFEGNDSLLAWLRTDEEFYLEPVFVNEYRSEGSAEACFIETAWGEGQGYDMYLHLEDNPVEVRDGFMRRSMRDEFSSGDNRLIPVLETLQVAGDDEYHHFIERLISVDSDVPMVRIYDEDISIYKPDRRKVQITYDPPRNIRFDLELGASITETRTETLRHFEGGVFKEESVRNVSETQTYVGREIVKPALVPFFYPVCRFEFRREIQDRDGQYTEIENLWFDTEYGIPLRQIINGRQYITGSFTPPHPY
ncbi:hypothetical protein [Parahaliea aestuarii]|uniref:Bacterial repeat domain-containing protein n=1 Tax=Parahaliea aestuarii TaxID=1852021 RepID=A0A5C9A400_9GAMM|nr:hypothetical protein [Parahaliea aestuarii]TXS94500.1 hypothetical protein FVW59_00850 [Parahaliea aestuarii]